jgi:uncharacterized SAM-binding protein YcdF (DUF218 family)
MLVLAKAVGILLTPPGMLIILALAGVLLQLRWRYLGAAVAGTSLMALLVLSLPATGHALLSALEDTIDAVPTDYGSLGDRAGAIVVLGGGRRYDAREYGGDTINRYTLERLRYGVRLHRLTGLPLLVSGGSVYGETAAEGELMQEALTRDFQARATWIESRSRNTYENAVYSRAILEAAGIQRVILVTHAWHMPRAVWAFRQAGMAAIAAPTGYVEARGTPAVLDLLPAARGLALSSRALHERLGLLWYRWRYSTPADAGIATERASLLLPLPLNRKLRAPPS